MFAVKLTFFFFFAWIWKWKILSKFSHISVFFSQYVPTAKICTFYHYCSTYNRKLNSVWTCALFHFVLNDSSSNYHPFYLYCKFSFFKQDFCFSLWKYFMIKEIKILTNGLNLRMLNQSIVRFFFLMWNAC